MKIRFLLVALSCLLTPGLVLAQDDAQSADESTATVDESTESPAKSSQTQAAPPSVFGTTVERGWDKDYALLFQLNNIFTNSAILSSYQGMGAGGRWHYKEDLALRAGMTLFYNNNPTTEVETIDVQGGERTTTVTEEGRTSIGTPNGVDVRNSNPSTTNDFDLVLRADALKRLSQKALTPYAGVGVQLNYNYDKTSFIDENSTVDNELEVYNKTHRYTLALRGMFGVEWMIHESFSIFAEYGLMVELLEHNQVRNITTMVDSSAGEPAATRTRVESQNKSVFDTSFGLSQGGAFGLAVHF